MPVAALRSPHLIEARERIRINMQPISRDMFARYFWMCWDLLHDNPQPATDHGPPMPTYFRFLTLLAFKVFCEEKVDLAILEVGMGGLYDATNIVKAPAVCGITSLAIEHKSILGSTLAEIATQKAGILKAGIPAFVVPQMEEAMVTVTKCAYDADAPLQIVPDYASCVHAGIGSICLPLSTQLC